MPDQVKPRPQEGPECHHYLFRSFIEIMNRLAFSDVSNGVTEATKVSMSECVTTAQRDKGVI